jgi:hypothetical protein
MSEMSDFLAGLKGQESHGTTRRYDAESVFGLKEEKVTERSRLWYKNSFRYSPDRQIVFGRSNEERKDG